MAACVTLSSVIEKFQRGKAIGRCRNSQNFAENMPSAHDFAPQLKPAMSTIVTETELLAGNCVTATERSRPRRSSSTTRTHSSHRYAAVDTFFGAPKRALPRRVLLAPTLRAGQAGRLTALNQLEGKDIYTRDSRECSP